MFGFDLDLLLSGTTVPETTGVTFCKGRGRKKPRLEEFLAFKAHHGRELDIKTQLAHGPTPRRNTRGREGAPYWTTIGTGKDIQNLWIAL